MKNGEDKCVITLGGLHIDNVEHIWRQLRGIWLNRCRQAVHLMKQLILCFSKQPTSPGQLRHAYQVTAVALAKLQQDAFPDEVNEGP